jgi:hypothetical protein
MLHLNSPGGLQLTARVRPSSRWVRFPQIHSTHTRANGQQRPACGSGRPAGAGALLAGGQHLARQDVFYGVGVRVRLRVHVGDDRDARLQDLRRCQGRPARGALARISRVRRARILALGGRQRRTSCAPRTRRRAGADWRCCPQRGLEQSSGPENGPWSSGKLGRGRDPLPKHSRSAQAVSPGCQCTGVYTRRMRGGPRQQLSCKPSAGQRRPRSALT